MHHCTFGQKIPILSLKNSDDLFFSHHPPLRSCALYREIISFTTFFKILPQKYYIISPKKSDDLFFTHFPLTQMITRISYPSIPAYIYCFFAFLHLALCSRNNK